MTHLEAPEHSDPFYDWLVLRLEQFTSEDANGVSAGHNATGAEMLHDAQRAQRCLEALAAVWPNANSAETVDGGPGPLSGKSRDDSSGSLAVETLGRFRIQRLLGRGGMGNVFLAFDPTLERSVALKVPRFDVAGDPELRERFLLEARAAARLSHPNLVEVYDAGLDGSMCYIASAYCDGPDLATWLAERDGPVEPELAARLVARLAEAIHCCHQVGIVHRDLKPANILLVPIADDKAASQAGLPFVPKITDFGLARA